MWKAAGDADVAKVKPEAALAVADFIRNADLFQFDLLDNPVLAELASDPKYQPLYKLLTLVIDGDVKVSRPDSSRRTRLEAIASFDCLLDERKPSSHLAGQPNPQSDYSHKRAKTKDKLPH